MRRFTARRSRLRFRSIFYLHPQAHLMVDVLSFKLHIVAGLLLFCV